MRIYTIQKLNIYTRYGMFSYFEIKNTVDIIKIIDHDYSELVQKYKYLYHIQYVKSRLEIDDKNIFNSNPHEYFTNGIYKTEEDSNDYYLISFVDI